MTAQHAGSVPAPRPAPGPSAGAVPPLFAALARWTREQPDAPAVTAEDGTLTYADLTARTAATAAALAAAGAGPESAVGLLLGRSRESVPALLAVWSLGATAVPLDPGHPVERLASVLLDARASLLVAADVPEGLDLAGVRTAPPAGAGSGELAVTVPAPDTCAYVIYTSGSTGDPKGVMTDHRGALNTVVDINERFAVGADDRVFALSSLGFDLSVYDIFGTLATGAALVLPGPGEERDPVRWARLVAEHGVTVWNSVPALMEMLLVHARGNPAANVEGLRLVMLSGDWIPVSMSPTAAWTPSSARSPEWACRPAVSASTPSRPPSTAGCGARCSTSSTVRAWPWWTCPWTDCAAPTHRAASRCPPACARPP